MERFFLDTCGGGHWYVVPAAKRKEWQEWTYSDSQTPPPYVMALEGPVNRIEFVDWHPTGGPRKPDRTIGKESLGT